MVSSKCCAVVSPSPFRFLAALMPPCAQTECERFTGTIENTSTAPPISAILMPAASPASPPPTTMIFGTAMLHESDLPGATRNFFHKPASSLSHHDIVRARIRIQRLVRRAHEPVHADRADRNQGEG